MIRRAALLIAVTVLSVACAEDSPTPAEPDQVATVSPTSRNVDISIAGICPLSNAWQMVPAAENADRDRNDDGFVCVTTSPSGKTQVMDNQALGGALDELEIAELSKVAAEGVIRACMGERADEFLDQSEIFEIDTISECNFICDFMPESTFGHVCSLDTCEDSCIRARVDE
jgi:hypothetical protein